MRRWLISIVVLAMLAVACGDGGGVAEDSGATSPSADMSSQADTPATTAAETPAAETTSTQAGTDDGAANETPTTTAAPREEPEGDPAPDFTLALGDGGEFSLSAEQKPVYLVFWAEW